MEKNDRERDKEVNDIASFTYYYFVLKIKPHVQRNVYTV